MSQPPLLSRRGVALPANACTASPAVAKLLLRYAAGNQRKPMKHILIVDDEPNIGRSLQLILDREGYRVSIFHSADEFRRAAVRRADAYLVDVKLPDGNGIDLL